MREVADDVGLSVSQVDRGGQMVHMILDAEAADPHGQIRIKIETNIAETTPFKTPTTIHHAVASRWWNGAAPIPTFVVEEMMSTKLRALYQRRKGRDLFDLWLVLTGGVATPAEIVGGLKHYMQKNVFTYPQAEAEPAGEAGRRGLSRRSREPGHRASRGLRHRRRRRHTHGANRRPAPQRATARAHS